jgi:uncharacterized membrane protein YgdD (TMEM256/DUF423 family)
MTPSRWATVGAVLGGLAVALGAFGAHGLRDRLSPADLATFDTGARYQMYHALALLAVAWLADRAPSRAVETAGWAFLIGMLVFSGSLYLLTLGGLRWMGAVAPLGGVSFLIGWVALALASRSLARRG